jgi:pilus assembly protein Flp/PilA
MITLFKNLWNDESGQGLVEYALILALISIVAIVVMGTLGGKITAIFTKADGALVP